MTFVDTNVVIDIVTDTPRWADWSAARLEDAATNGIMYVDAIVAAEASRNFPNELALLRTFASLNLTIVPIEVEAAFLAGRRFVDYRRSRAEDGMVRALPDFFIGAHALTLGIPLLTCDPRLYRRYFPDLTLITPETDHG